jgi:hypothetical protein
MYAFSLFILGTLAILLLLMMNLMTDGFTVSTATFIAHETSSFPPRSDFAMSVVDNLYNLFGYLYLIMAVHTGLSIVADFIARPALWLIKTIKIIVFGYD